MFIITFSDETGVHKIIVSGGLSLGAVTKLLESSGKLFKVMDSLGLQMGPIHYGFGGFNCWLTPDDSFTVHK